MKSSISCWKIDDDENLLNEKFTFVVRKTSEYNKTFWFTLCWGHCYNQENGLL